MNKSAIVACIAAAATAVKDVDELPEWLSNLVKEREGENYGIKDHTYIHLITHTHDDVGWLKTVDEYYSGTNRGTDVGKVSFILDSVIGELLKDPKKVFTYVEMKFFSMWYER